MNQKTRNIILFIMLCLATFFINFMVIKLNQKRLNNILSQSDIKNYLAEITYEGISNKVIEEPNSVIYVSNSSLDESLKFEKIFIPLIKKYNLENYITYININELSITDPFYQNAPELIFYSQSSVSDVIDCNVIKSKKQLEKELRQRGIIND